MYVHDDDEDIFGKCPGCIYMEIACCALYTGSGLVLQFFRKEFSHQSIPELSLRESIECVCILYFGKVHEALDEGSVLLVL
jgi:hypothetical protein